MSTFLRSCVAMLSVFLLTPGNSYAQEELTLQQAIELALANNPDVQMAQKEAEAANARILQAEAIPNLEFGISWGETPANFNVADADERNIGVVQPFEFPGKRKARGSVARRESRFFAERAKRTQRLVIAEVKLAYYQVWLDEKLVANLAAIADLLQQFRETATARYQAQKVTFLEVLRAKIELAKINNEIITARRESQNSLAELNRVMGRAGATPITIADDFVYQPFEKTVDALVAEMRQLSAARRMAETLVERNQEQIILAKKSYLPDFAVGLFNQSLKEQPPFNANNYFGTKINSNWQIDLGVSIPLWHWKRPKGEVQEARAALGLAQVQYEAFDRNVVTAIENAHRSVKAAEEQVRLFEDTLLRDVEDQLSMGIAHYQNNQIDALNLTDIYRTITETKAEYYRALYNYYVSLVDLEVAGETAM